VHVIDCRADVETGWPEHQWARGEATIRAELVPSDYPDDVFDRRTLLAEAAMRATAPPVGTYRWDCARLRLDDEMHYGYGCKPAMRRVFIEIIVPFA
jgi:hypothetical protein